MLCQVAGAQAGRAPRSACAQESIEDAGAELERVDWYPLVHAVEQRDEVSRIRGPRPHTDQRGGGTRSQLREWQGNYPAI